ncbi:P0434C04.20 [Oryza sativa (japonica cultivar-group)]
MGSTLYRLRTEELLEVAIDRHCTNSIAYKKGSEMFLSYEPCLVTLDDFAISGCSLKYPKRGKATTPTPILKILPSLSNKYPKRRKITTPTPITFIYYEISKEGKDNNTNTNVTYSDIMQQEQFAVAEISRISDTKTLMEQNLCNLKKAIKSPSSDNLRRIVALTRRIGAHENQP